MEPFKGDSSYPRGSSLSGKTVPPHMQNYGETQRRIEERFVPPQLKDTETYSVHSDADHSSTIDGVIQQKKTRKRKVVRRVRKRRPNPMRKGILLTLLGVILLIIILSVAPVPFGRILVEGNTNITAQSLVDSGVIKSPVNIIRIKDSVLRKDISNDLRVASVDTHYQFPATLVVTIQQREPIAIVISRFGYAEIDKNGQYIKLSSSISSKNIPIISGVQVGNILLGENVTDNKVKEGLTYLQALGAEGREAISEINVGNKDSFVAYTVDGIRLELGKPDHLKEKADLTIQMLKDIARQNINVNSIDVNLDAPYVKP